MRQKLVKHGLAIGAEQAIDQVFGLELKERFMIL